MLSLRADGELCIGRNGRPAAAHRDVGIAERGLPDPLRRAFVIGGLMRQRQRSGRARFRRGGGRRPVLPAPGAGVTAAGLAGCGRRAGGGRADCRQTQGAAVSIDGNGNESSVSA